MIRSRTGESLFRSHGGVQQNYSCDVVIRGGRNTKAAKVSAQPIFWLELVSQAANPRVTPKACDQLLGLGGHLHGLILETLGRIHGVMLEHHGRSSSGVTRV